MKLIIFRGSPRGKASNSQLLIDRFVDGLRAAGEEEPPVRDLKRTDRHEEQIQQLADADAALFFFPLYTDCMPGIVMAFFEKLREFRPRGGRPRVGFVVQSGFVESVHSLALERYLEKLCRRLGVPHLGTVIRGGGEGLKEKRAFGYREVTEAFARLGEHFARTGELDRGIVMNLRRIVRLPLPMRLLFGLLGLLGLTDLHWNRQLQANGAYRERFARPYA